MPISLPPLSRRRFLGGSLTLGAGLLVRRPAWGADERAGTDPHRFALLSDSHIDADPAAVNSGVNMADNLKQVCGEVLKLDKPPAAVVVNGDCARTVGTAGEYATFLRHIAPLREAGLPVHLTLGNHDHRERFWQAVPAASAGTTRPAADRQATIVPAARANWIILDSLDKTNSTPGLLGEKQLAWLAATLDARADKPALVMTHHNPEGVANLAGLIDSKALMDILLPRKHVKALFFGHTHNWQVRERDGLHLVNFPPTGYVFTRGRPSGWVDAHVGEKGMTVELRATDVKHPEHGQKHELAWRA